MNAQNTYPLLRESLEFTADILKYSEILERENRKPIAQKLLQSGMNLSTFLYQAQSSILPEDFRYKLEKALLSITEVLYWLNQCVKSRYISADERILRLARRIHKDIQTNLVE